MRLLLIVALIVLIIVAWPTWWTRNPDAIERSPWRRDYGYYPSGGLFGVLVVVLVLILLGVL
jgi:uncharacterized iron-regulated membrane protein